MPPPDDWDGGAIYHGTPGIALAFLRLERQAPALAERDESSPDFRRFASQLILPKGPQFYLQPRQLSPIGSSPLDAIAKRHPEQNALPLMWVLHEGYYGLGA
ncbi:hypothetical protein V1522DRAFT_422604 [Lipomyces starkeyi]